MGKKSITKGKRGERETANELTEATGLKHQRNLREVRHADEGDIDVPHTIPVVYQVRYGKGPSIWKAVRDAERQAGPLKHGVAVVKRDGERKIAAMPWSDYLEILEVLVKGGLWY
jgi:hypothetical protein